MRMQLVYVIIYIIKYAELPIVMKMHLSTLNTIKISWFKKPQNFLMLIARKGLKFKLLKINTSGNIRKFKFV
jgi:hypothetical protein